MKATQLAFLMALLLGATALQAKELVPNGNFKEVAPKNKEQEKLVKGENFATGWGIAGSGPAEVLSGGGLSLANGVIYTWMLRPWTDPAGELKGEITASGSGKLIVRFSTCVYKKADGPFGHDKSTVVVEITLTEESKSTPFKYAAVAGEVGYIYIGVEGAAQISRVSIDDGVAAAPAENK